MSDASMKREADSSSQTSPPRRTGIVLLALALLVIGAVVAASSVQQLQQRAALGDAWAALNESDWDAVLIQTEGVAGAEDAVAREAAEIRCWALLGLGRRADCAEMLIQLSAERAAAEWMPEPTLSGVAIGTLRDRGRLAEAASLAQRATRVHGNLPGLLQLELMTRGPVDGEEQVLADFVRRAEAAPEDVALRAIVALAHRRRGDYDGALGALGDVAPAGSVVGQATASGASDPLAEARVRWFDERTAALAALGRLPELRQTFVQWGQRGATPQELTARYALRVSTAQLIDPQRSWIELLEQALEARGQMRDRVLVRQLYERWIAHLLAEERVDEALAVYDRASAEGTVLEAISRGGIARGVALRASGSGGRGVLTLRLPDALAGEAFSALISPEASTPGDTDFEVLAFSAQGVLRVQRDASEWPVRWVVRDAQGAVRASGHTWPAAAGVEVSVALQPPALTPKRSAIARAAADGRRRVIGLILDCGDWRLVQYLRARGEVPTLDDLLAHGHRAVLESDPPLTAAAMESLVWPDRSERVSFVGWVHQMGVELAGLSSVGSNPFEALSALLPETQSLFDTVGAGDHVAANMLFTHGMIDAGRHAELVGPYGVRRNTRATQAYRPLTPEEQQRHPGLLAKPRARGHVESIAAELDAAEGLVDAGEVDLLLLRVEALDILTHALYGELSEGAQDQGHSVLLATYRYLDERIAQLEARLDEDDVLVVMSDHGVRTAMQHSSDAIFIARGGPVEFGRSPDRPHLRGVSHALVSLLGLDPDWPRTGVASWLPKAPEACRADPGSGSVPIGRLRCKLDPAGRSTETPIQSGRRGVVRLPHHTPQL